MISTSPSSQHQARLETTWSDASNYIGIQLTGPSRIHTPTIIPKYSSTNMPPPSQLPSTSSSSRPPTRKLLKAIKSQDEEESSSSGSSSSNGADADFEPTPPPKNIGTSTGLKRKRNESNNNSTSNQMIEKPVKGKGLSREQLRKVNHSLIERRRREKINAALDQLRCMVPGLGEASGGKGGEFKLEVSPIVSSYLTY